MDEDGEENWLWWWWWCWTAVDEDGCAADLPVGKNRWWWCAAEGRLWNGIRCGRAGREEEEPLPVWEEPDAVVPFPDDEVRPLPDDGFLLHLKEPHKLSNVRFCGSRGF